MIRNTRPGPVLALVAVLALSVSGLALAQSTDTTVTTTVGSGTRQLSVTDLAGQPLSQLALESGDPAPFRVNVSDSEVDLQGFQVDATLNNLYRVETDTTYDYATSIPSSAVDLDYALSPLDAIGGAVDVSPDYLLSGTDITCSDVASLLGLLDTLTDPLCLLLNDLTGGSLSFSDVPLDGSMIQDVGLESVDPADLPIVPSAGTDTGPFTEPDCVNGIGAGDTCTTSGTAHTVLDGTPVTGALTGTLDTLLDGALNTGNIVGTAGDELTTVTAVVAALQNSADSTVRDFGSRLTEYTDSEQITLINGLLTAAQVDLDALNLSGITGIYNSFPRLTVDSSSVPEGDYEGTLTVTLIE